MKLIAYGEIIWDVYEDGRKIGGAPFNFCAHAARLGDDARMYSAVGRDAPGGEALAIADSFGMRTELIQENARPTGACLVRLDDAGKPTYEIVKDVAYDCIEPTPAPLFADAFYFGTLIQRAPKSRETLRQTLAEGEFREIFCDVNLRPDCYDRESVRFALASATILKLSDDESRFLYELDLLPEDEREICHAIGEDYPNVKLVLYTLGAEGSIAYETATGRVVRSKKPRPKRVVSTVGAGDSFSAAFLHAYMAGEPLDVCVDKATDLSVFVVEHQDAIPDEEDEL